MSKMTDEITAWLLTFKSVRDWETNIQSETTKALYFKYFTQYCRAIGKNPDELLTFKVEGLQKIGEEKEFQAEKLLDSYLYNTGITDAIKQLVLSSVKSFYKENWRPLNPQVGSKLTVPEPKKRTPKMVDILELEDAMTSQRDKAILWFLESAPFRQGTLTKLLWKDLQSTKKLLEEIREESKSQITRTQDEDEQLSKDIPYYLVIESARLKGAGKGKYKGVKQVGFIHAYAAEKIEKYKIELKQKGIETSENSPIFVALGMNPSNKGKGDRLQSVALTLYYASVIAWNDIEHKKFSAQDFRDVLQSALENANIHPNIAAPLLGHKVPGVDKHYSSHDLGEFLLAYKRALPWLVPQSVEQIKAESEEKLAEERKELKKLQSELQTVKTKLAFLDPYFQLVDVVETKRDAQRLLDLLETMRKEQLDRERQLDTEAKAEATAKLSREKLAS